MKTMMKTILILEYKIFMIPFKGLLKLILAYIT